MFRSRRYMGPDKLVEAQFDPSRAASGLLLCLGAVCSRKVLLSHEAANETLSPVSASRSVSAKPMLLASPSAGAIAC